MTRHGSFSNAWRIWVSSQQLLAGCMLELHAAHTENKPALAITFLIQPPMDTPEMIPQSIFYAAEILLVVSCTDMHSVKS